MNVGCRPPRLMGTGIAIALALALVASPAAAQADAGIGPPFRLQFASNARLLPTLHANEVLDAAEVNDGHQYD
jgi:hypothetical protein